METKNENKKHRDRLARLREAMLSAGLDAYVIPSSDPHMSEYLPDRWKIMAWLTGFTGSAGTVVVTRDFAGVWTDSRYFLQAEEQLAGTGFGLMKLKIPHTPEYLDWLAMHLAAGKVVGFDGTLFSVALARRMERVLHERRIRTEGMHDLISPLWEDRPSFPGAPAFEHPVTFAGRSLKEKVEDIRSSLLERDCDALLLTALDEVAWTFNLRGHDIAYNPVVMAWGLITLEEVRLYIRPEKVPRELFVRLEAQGVLLRDYEAVTDDLAALPARSTLWLSPSSTNLALYRSLPPTVKVIGELTPAARLKALKNETELARLHEVMVRDGVAMVRFLRWLEEEVSRRRVTELTAARRLEAFRSEQPHFRGPSFATISSFGPHGAVVHYTPDAESDLPLEVPGLYLVDSGGQYLDGTTDITRTVALGEPTAEQRRDFTLVLRGMIDLAMARFPEGTVGHQLDVLARHPLWEEGLDYGHGTGHGVGYFLNVHEGPQSINPGKAGGRPVPLEPGMVISDEPGLYRDGAYGIRTENLVVVVKDKESSYGTFLRFETLTLCPVDLRLVEADLLTPTERQWLNDYHREVYERLSSHLDESHREWLKERTRPL